MSPHLDEKQLAQYRDQNLDAAELLAIDDHLSGCEQCRARLEAGMNAAAWSNLGRSDDRHFTYEQIVAYIDGTASLEQRRDMEEHLRRCPRCAADCDDLRTFSDEMRRPRRRPAAYYVALGSIAAAVLAGFLVLWSVERKPPATQSAQAPKLVAEVRDGGAVYAVDARGGLLAPAGFSPADRELIRSALIGAPLHSQVPDALLGRRTVVLRGAVSDESFRLLSPVAERVLSDRPRFQWEPIKGATGYKVEILTVDYETAAESPKITATEWTPGKALDRGKTYSWQVTALRRDGDVVAPRAPAPEARFEIVDAETAQRVEEARRHSRLLAAVLESNAGLRDDALQDIAPLEKENPGSPVLQRLRDSLSVPSH